MASSARYVGLSPLQLETSKKQYHPVPNVCVVTGGTGFVGQRLVEMLIERGAKKVRSFDIVPRGANFWDDPRIEYVVGDITDKDAVIKVCAGVDCVFHVAAIVGPFHPREVYEKVNYNGTLNVIEACRINKVPKLVMSSSPSTRFDGRDVDGLTEDQMPPLPQKSYMQIYAETKAKGEVAVRQACCDELMTIAVAPHQVYGPRDNLFLPNILEAAGTGRLRIFSSPRTGYGMNRICFTHVDNYCHGLILGAEALYKGSPALGKFYIVTDGNTHPHPEGYCEFWKVIDEPIVSLGFPSIWDKFKLPAWLLFIIAFFAEIVGWILGTQFKLNIFNVRLMIMHRWFRITAAEKDLNYQPIIGFKEGLADTTEWFRQNWLPKFQNRGLVGLYEGSQKKIDIQAQKIKSD